MLCQRFKHGIFIIKGYVTERKVTLELVQLNGTDHQNFSAWLIE